MSERRREQERLFDVATAKGSQAIDRDAPLARRMRPRTIDEVAGQEHLLGTDAVLRRSLERGLLSAGMTPEVMSDMTVKFTRCDVPQPEMRP